MTVAAEPLHGAFSRGVRGPPTPAALRTYGSVRGVTLQDSARLYLGYGTSVFQKLFRPRSYSCVGAAVPGATPLTVSTAGFKARVRPGTNDLDLLVHHEPLTRRWFQVRPGDVVVDVGAHIGLYTLLSARSGARVIAFEPDPANFRMLAENIELNGFANVDAIAAAVGRQPGWLELLPADGSNRGTSSVRVPRPDELAPASIEGWVAVRCDSLDGWLGSHELPQIDWLKVDVEGYEAEVLAGARSTLVRTRHLILEVTPEHADVCLQLTKAAGLARVGEEPGAPASNWFFSRESGR